MSRHRNLKDLEREYYEDEEDYGEYGSYEGGGYSPSPGSSQYLYNNARKPVNPIASILDKKINEKRKATVKSAVKNQTAGKGNSVITAEDYEDYNADEAGPQGFYEAKNNKSKAKQIPGGKQIKEIEETNQDETRTAAAAADSSSSLSDLDAAAVSAEVSTIPNRPTRSASSEAAQSAAVESIRLEKLRLANADKLPDLPKEKSSSQTVGRASSQVFDPVAAPVEINSVDGIPQVSAKRTKERLALLESESKKESKPRLNMVVIGHVDAGKCWSAGTKLMKFTGELESVENIKEGQLLMGDDSKPRSVISGSLNRGFGEMFSIIPQSESGQQSFNVNGNHILVLSINQPEADIRARKSEFYSIDQSTNQLQFSSQSFSSAVETEKFQHSLNSPLLWEVSVRQFLSHSDEIQSKCQMFRPKSIEFPITDYSLESRISSIFQVFSVNSALLASVGWLIGQSISHPNFNIPTSLLRDSIIQHHLSVWFEFAENSSFDISNIDFSLPFTAINLGNPFDLLLSDYQSNFSTHIPQSLIVDSELVRSAVFNGILSQSNFSSNSPLSLSDCSQNSLFRSENFLFLVRSLGYSVCFPTHSTAMKITSDYSNWNFSISRLPVAEYFGFSVSGSNERLLMSDFTVSHNSTLMGHMLYLKGHVSKKLMHKYEKESKEMNKSSFHFAWVLDEHEEERSRGITVDVAVNYFETENKRITLLDAPGHRDFIPNMISGTAQADSAILVVPAVRGEFESGFVDDGQTKEHAILARALGISQIIIAVNKLDQCDWSEERFNEINGILIPFLKTAGFKEKDIWPIPVSGLTGENLIERKEAKLSAWYTGPTLIDLIDRFALPTRPVDKPFRMSLSDVFRGQSSGITVAGKIESGAVINRDQLLLLPVNELVTVKSLEQRGEALQVAKAGDNVEISLKDLSDNSVLCPGQWLCAPESPIPLVSHFRAQILTLNHKIPILAGSQAVMFTQSASEPVVVQRLIHLLDKATGSITKINPRALPRQSSAVVDIVSKRPICLELFSKYRELGRFTLRLGSQTVAVGIVLKLFRS